MEDPKLTPFGDAQCRLLRENFPRHDPIDLLVCSPLRRTVYTTLISFQPEIEQRGLKVIALPELQEVGDWPCDTGSDLAVIREEFEGKPVDLSRVPDDWNSNKGQWGPGDDVVKKRAAKVRQWLKARKEKNIVVVTHGGLVHYLTCDWTGDGKFEGMLFIYVPILYQCRHSLFFPFLPQSGRKTQGHLLTQTPTIGTGWDNTEFRSYRFVNEDASNDDDAIDETPESRQRRQGTEKPLADAEEAKLNDVESKSS